MADLSWMEIRRNIYHVTNNRGEGIIYSPLQGTFFSADGEAQGIVEDFVASKNPSNHTFNDLLEEAGMLEEVEEPAMPQKIIYKPTRVMLSLSNLCNLHCIYCYAYTEAKSRPRMLAWEKTTKVIDSIFNFALESDEGSIEICFHGTGETLVKWDEFRKTVAYAVKNKPDTIELKFALVTNGSLLDTQKANFLARYDFFVTLSMDGIESVQNTQRPLASGKGSFDKVVNGIESLVNAGVAFIVRSTVTKTNLETMSDFVYLCAEKGCKQVSFMPFSATGRGATGLEPINPDLFLENYLKSQVVARGFDIDLSVAGTEIDEVNSYYCGAVGFNCVITPDGNISTCSRVTNTEEALAPVFFIGEVTTNGLSFDEDRLNSLISLNLDSYDQCKECFARYVCSGGCPHDRLSNGHLMPDYWCEIVRNLVWHEIRYLALNESLV